MRFRGLRWSVAVLLVAALSPVAASSRAEAAAGPIAYRIFEGAWGSVPDFGALTAVESGTVDAFTVDVRGARSDTFGLRFWACLDAPVTGTYTFSLFADDGALLRNDGAVVVDNDGVHPPQLANGTIALTAGTHALVVDYFELSGYEVLQVGWSPPGAAAPTAIPLAALSTGCEPAGGGSTGGNGTTGGGSTGGGTTGGGVSFAVFDGSWGGLPDFALLTPAITGTTAAMDLSIRGNRQDNFGIRYTTCLNVTTAGVHTFATRSDDGSTLRIGSTLVVDNGGYHAPQLRTGTINLPAGTHPLVVDYFEATGGETLDVTWQPPGATTLQPIPTTTLTTTNPCTSNGTTNVAPELASPGDQITEQGAIVDLQLIATDANADPLSFSSTALPAGLVLDAQTGRITGSPSTLGQLTVTASVSDGIASTQRSFIWSVVEPSGPRVFTTLGRRGERGDSTQPATASDVRMNWAHDVAIDSQGVVYIADMFAHRVRRFDPATGLVTTIAGNGTAGFAGDGGVSTAAVLNNPINLAVDAQDNLYVSDWSNHRVRRIDRATGIITTVAGNGTKGYTGDGMAATATGLDSPEGVAFDGAGNMFIADFGNNRVRRVAAGTGIISTVAGRGIPTSDGDGGPATAAGLHGSTSVAVDAAGHLYVTDYGAHRVRRVDGATGIISTVAGVGVGGFSGDGGPASAAALHGPESLVLTARACLSRIRPTAGSGGSTWRRTR
jgi:sugar lactone lactonase YvrE